MEAYVTGCCARIMSLVGDWATTEDPKILEEDLLAIIFSALRLAQMLRCQRACWSIRHLGSAIPGSLQADRPIFFDSETMVDKHMDEDSEEDSPTRYRKIVEVIVTPSLFKRGDTDGERFEVESCVEKTEVKCREASVASGLQRWEGRPTPYDDMDG